MAQPFDLIDRIANALPVDDDQYPSIAGASDKAINKYAIEHQALHFSKTAGKIASIAEGLGHGTELSEEDHIELEEQIAASIINALRLAATLGLRAGDVEQLVNERLTALEG